MAEAKENHKLSQDANDWVASGENTLNRLIQNAAKAADQPEPTIEELDKLRDDTESQSTR